MDSKILLYVLFFSTMFLSIEGFEANCPTLKCSDASPDIRFPFQVSTQQQQQHHNQHCGLPGFELSCRENTTVFHFPNYGELVVKSISYKIKKLDLLDPKNCVHEVFFNLNLSIAPFRYYYNVKNYTYLNCSTRLSNSFVEIPCLSRSNKHHVYTVESSLLDVPTSCVAVKTVAIPFSFSPFLADNSFGLGLTWSLPTEQDRKGSGCVSAKFWKVMLCFVAVAMLAGSIKIYVSKKQCTQIEDENTYKALVCCKTQQP